MEQASATTKLETAGIRIIASTDSKDRDGRIVHQDGWDLDAFRRTPVLMLDHGYLDERGRKLPIGRVGSIEVEEGRLMAGDITWAKDPISQMVREMYEPSDGTPPIMTAASAGWIPLEAPVQKEDGEHHVRQELAELSLTAIPSNRETVAFVTAAFRGLMHTSSATVEPTVPDPEPAPEPEPVVVTPAFPVPPEGTSSNAVDVTVTVNEEAAELLAPTGTNRTPAVESAEEANGEGSAPEQASGLTTRQQVERAATVTAQIADAMYRRLTGRLPD